MYICHKRFFAVNKVRLIYPRGVLQTRLIWQIEWIGSTEDISDKGIKLYENQCKSKVKYKIKRRRRESETSGRKTKKSPKLFRFNFNPKSKRNIYLARKSPKSLPQVKLETENWGSIYNSSLQVSWFKSNTLLDKL